MASYLKEVFFSSSPQLYDEPFKQISRLNPVTFFPASKVLSHISMEKRENISFCLPPVLVIFMVYLYGGKSTKGML